jgi:aromatic-amino-acid transaminase
MAALSPASRPLFEALEPQAPDALLALIKLFRDDPRDSKIDLGVGVYRDAAGATPVMKAVKIAEAMLQETQPTKAYLGPEGDPDFLAAIQPIVFGAQAPLDLASAQTPGGTGALCLAAALVQAARPGGRIWLGTPSWPNHRPIFEQAGLTVSTYRYFDPETQTVRFDEMMQALGQAEAGDVALLHGCCHNPTGGDLTPEQWDALAGAVARRGLVPLIDLAYQGLGEGLEPDAAGLRTTLGAVDDVLVAYSCDKNFGLYRERVGALFVRAKGRAALVEGNILKFARAAWSMPPDHGAAVVRTILSDPALSATWRQELDGMRARLRTVRRQLAAQIPSLSALSSQNGLFAQLPVTSGRVERLRRDHGVYMAASGRINLAGLNAKNIPQFAAALMACEQGAYA